MNKRKRYPLASLFIALCLFSLQAHANERTIEVSGTAKVSVTPDMATFSFAISSRGKTLASEKNAVDQKTSKLISLCKQVGIQSKNISSAEVSIHPQYNYQTQSLTGYEVSREVTATLKNLKKYTELVNGSIQAGITNIRGIVLDTKDRDNLQQQALIAAIQDAKKKAKVLATHSGVKLGKVTNIKESASPVKYQNFKVMRSGSIASTAQNTFEPGEILVTADVFMTYAIDDK